MKTTAEKFWEKGLYKRGFVIATERALFVGKLPKYWQIIDLPNQSCIAYDPENTLVFSEKKEVWVCLCGSYCMDTTAGHMDMQLIVDNLAKALFVSDESFYDYLDELNGRFVCIFSKKGSVSVLNDATASRSVYYATDREVIASHYNLVHDIVATQEDPFWEKYCEWVDDKKKERKPWPWVMPGDRTPWANIKILPPNHKIILPAMQSVRFYPRCPMPETNIEAATSLIANTLSKETETLTQYFSVYQSLTAGSDTRITLAAMRNVAKKAVFFTYHDARTRKGEYESEDRLQNFEKAKEICERENLCFREIVIPETPIDPALKDVLNRNHYHKSISLLLDAYADLFHNGSIHLRSNLIEIIRGNEHAPLNTVDPNKTDIGEYFASLNGYNRSYKYAPEAASIFSDYYSASALDNLYDYPMSQIFYWEYRIGSWLSGAILMENDLVCDTFQLFNCRKILNVGLALPSHYRNRSILYDTLIKKLWPELLNYGLPNQKVPLFDLLNRNEIKGGQVAFDNKIEYFSGNVYDKERRVSAIFEPYAQGLNFGFAANKLNRGDFCSFRTTHRTEKDLNYFYQLEVKNTWVQGAGGGIVYELLINKQPVYKLSTISCYYVNQIRYSFKASETRTNTIEFRLRAERDIGAIHNGNIDVRCLELKRDFGNEYDYKPSLIDTIHAVKEQDTRLKIEKLTKSSLSNLPTAHRPSEKVPDNETPTKYSALFELQQVVNSQVDINNLGKTRSELIYGADKSYLEDRAIFIDLENITMLPNGRFRTKLHGVEFDCLFHLKKGMPLYVIFSGSKTSTPPVFKRWSWYNIFGGSVLNIADPSYALNEKLYLGWYYGTATQNYRDFIAEMVCKIASFLNVRNEDIYFYASSGGGPAAIQCASIIEGSTAMVINPQIFLELYHYAPTFRQLTGIDLSKEDPSHRQDVSYYLLNSPKSNFLLIENLQSEDDTLQFYALEKKLGTSFKYGITRLNNLGIWLYDANTKNSPTHNAQEDQTLYFAIDYLAKSMKTCTDWDHLEELYLVISELWRTQWQLRDSLALQKKNIQS